MTVQKFHTMTSLSNNFFWKCSFCNSIVFEKESHYTPCPFCKKARLKMYKKCPCGEIFPVERSNQSFAQRNAQTGISPIVVRKGSIIPVVKEQELQSVPFATNNLEP